MNRILTSTIGVLAGLVGLAAGYGDFVKCSRGMTCFSRGYGVYCCGLFNDQCCYYEIYQVWWFWAVWIIVFILACICSYNVRRRALFSRQESFTDGVGPVTSQRFHSTYPPYCQPRSPTFSGQHHQPPPRYAQSQVYTPNYPDDRYHNRCQTDAHQQRANYGSMAAPSAPSPPPYSSVVPPKYYLDQQPENV